MSFDTAVSFLEVSIVMNNEKSFDFMKNTLVIDADGCPVVKIAAKIAQEYKADCLVVCDSAHIFNIDGVRSVVVSQGADSVDFYIVNNIKKNDIVITQDYGLAAMCLAKNSVVINQNGQIYSDDNIGGLLESRAIGKKIRRAGGRTKGPSKRTDEQNKTFEITLRQLFENAKV